MEIVFEIGTRVTFSGWLALAIGLFFPAVRTPLFVYGGRVLPGALALGYLVLLILYFAAGAPGFSGGGSLEGLSVIYADPAAVTAAWFHFCVADLLIGHWIVRDGLDRGYRRLALLPILIVTMLAGPLGALVWMGLRALPPRRPASSTGAVR